MHLLDIVTAKINQIILIFALIVLGATPPWRSVVFAYNFSG
jgi:hypothetical protein